MHARWAVILVSLSARLLMPTAAHAFCRETTVKPPLTFAGTTCWDQGLDVYWKNGCVGYTIQEGGSTQLTVAQAQQTIDTAIAAWTSATCTPSGQPSIAVQFIGTVACHTPGYNQQSGNANIVMFDDDKWPYATSKDAETLALTQITYNLDTGELYDADIEVNTAQNTFSLDGSGPSTDLLAVFTHEMGHFLGLAHSLDMKATMFAQYQGAAMESLASDDVTGICTIYAPDGTRATSDGGLASGPCDTTPRHGFSAECSGAGVSGCGCVTAGRGDYGAGAIGGVGAIGLFGWRRRRRSSSDRRGSAPLT